MRRQRPGPRLGPIVNLRVGESLEKCDFNFSFEGESCFWGRGYCVAHPKTITAAASYICAASSGVGNTPRDRAWQILLAASSNAF